MGAGVGHGMNQALGLTDAAGKATSNYQGYQGMDRIARAALSGFAAGTATTLARGGRVAVTQIATDAFGNALGNTFGGELAAQAEFDRISTQFDAMQAAARKGLAFRTDMNGNVSTLPARSLAKTGQPSGSFAEPDAQAAQQSMRDGAARIRGMQAYGQGVQLASAGAYAGMEVLSDSAPSPFNAEWAMMTGGDDRVDRTVVANQTPVAAKPGDRTDPLGRVVRIGDGQYTEREILQIARGLQVGDAAGTPFLDQARTILREHGFRTGVTGTEESMRAVTDVDRRVALIRGDSNTEIAQLQRSADVALETGGQELNERRAVFSGDGKVTRIMEDGSTRTVKISFASNTTGLAESIGVSAQEAKAKTDWRVVDTAISAAIATGSDMRLELSGLWRPDFATFQDYFRNSQDAKFANATTQAQRDEMAKTTLIDAGVRRESQRASINLDGKPIWSPAHSTGNGVDVTRINGILINRSVGEQQPAIVDQFSRQLAVAGASQVIQPWMTYGVSNLPVANPPRISMDDGFLSNANKGIEASHRNHLHFGVR